MWILNLANKVFWIYINSILPDNIGIRNQMCPYFNRGTGSPKSKYQLWVHEKDNKECFNQKLSPKKAFQLYWQLFTIELVPELLVPWFDLFVYFSFSCDVKVYWLLCLIFMLVGYPIPFTFLDGYFNFFLRRLFFNVNL